MCCQGNEISHSLWYNLSKQTNDNPALFFTSYCDVKESLKKSSNYRFYSSNTSPGYFYRQLIMIIWSDNMPKNGGNYVNMFKNITTTL